MSDEEPVQEEVTLAKLVEGVLAQALGQHGAMITGYLGVVTYMDDEGNHCWSFLRSEEATATNELGMAHTILKIVDAAVDEAYFGGA